MSKTAIESELRAALAELFAGPAAACAREIQASADPELLAQLSENEQRRGFDITSESRKKEWAEGRRCILAVEDELGDGRVLTSLTHSGGIAAAVGILASDLAVLGVGLDLERADREVKPTVKSRIVRPEEAGLGLELLDFWVIKEACYKANPRSEGTLVQDYQVIAQDRARWENDTEFAFKLVRFESWRLAVAIARVV